MAIDLEVFERKFSLLLKRFDKPIDGEVIAEYYRLLRGQLTTEEFAEACDRVFFEDDFFPSPQKLVDKARGSSKDLAAADWAKILAQSSNSSFNPPGLSEVGEKALRAIGGMWAVGHANIQTELPHLRRQFLEQWSSAKSYEVIESRRMAGGSEPNYLSGGDAA